MAGGADGESQRKCELGEQQRTGSTTVPLLLAVATRSRIGSAFVTAANGAAGLDVLDGYSASVIKCRCSVTGADQDLARFTVGQRFILPRARMLGRPGARGARREGATHFRCFQRSPRRSSCRLPRFAARSPWPGLAATCAQCVRAGGRARLRAQLRIVETEKHDTGPGACARARGIRSAAVAKSSRSAAPTTSPCARPFPAHGARAIRAGLELHTAGRCRQKNLLLSTTVRAQPLGPRSTSPQATAGCSRRAQKPRTVPMRTSIAALVPSSWFLNGSHGLLDNGMVF